MTFVRSAFPAHRAPRTASWFCLILLLLGISTFSNAQESASTEGSQDEKYQRMTRVSAADAIALLGDSLFGDSTSYYTGTTTFSITDIDLPGNSSLPVRLTRTHTASEAKGKLGTGLLGEWELELPNLHGTFSVINGWQVGGPNPYNRCSVPPYDRNTPSALTTVNGQPANVSMAGTDFWNGNFLSIPGQGDQLLLVRSADNTLIPTDGQSHGCVKCFKRH